MKIKPILLKALLPFVLYGCASTFSVNAVIFNGISLSGNGPHKQDNCTPSKGTLEYLLNDIWNSGFIVKSERNKKEILDNSYGIFPVESELDICGMNCNGAHANGYILLNESLFCTDLTGRLKIFRSYNTPPDNVLVHELFHDFFYKLMDDDSKNDFTELARDFYYSVLDAETSFEKLELLRDVGFDDPVEKDFDSVFSKLREMRKAYTKMDEDRFLSEELFSIFVENAYAGRFNIPEELRVFYRGLISDSFMDKKFK